jgi:hypothetical protein
MADALDQSMEACFQTFTVTEVVSIAGEVVQLPRGAKRNRQLLLDTLSQFSPDVQHRIKVIAMSRVGRKRKAAVTPHTTKKRARTETPEPIDVDVQLMDGPFFQPPSKEVTEGAVIRYVSGRAIRNTYSPEQHD